jgi:yecA family protein
MLYSKAVFLPNYTALLVINSLTKSMSNIDYQQLTQALERLQIAADAAECQGAMSAVICLSGADGLASWLPAHFPEIEAGVAEGNALAGEAKQLIVELYQSTLGQLGQGNFDYALLMPDDEDSLEERTDALGHWCQGFLLGLRYSGVGDPGQFSGELAEILDDIREISQVTSAALENTEEEEQSYSELVEYLRVGVMLFCETLQASKGATGSKLVH